MKKHIIISAMTILLATTAITSTTLACEQAKHGSYKTHHGKSVHHSIPGKSFAYLRLVVRSAKELGLSEKQQAEVGKLLVKAEAGAAAAHAKAEVVVAEFKSKLYSGKVTEKDVRAYSKKMGELRAESLAARLLPSIQIKSILSAEQREKLKALHRKERNKSCLLKGEPHHSGAHT
ncbi:Spy/CpxP family protein refolding chaperone [Mariprofundus ferrooxydans]|uniref:Spy/CpxP family protein refolding chaperone n=1 Tax=Mariprofundus ferrooxydans TaxID=314344 RepID=UPI0006A73C82|nr:Spy/CpxP family protein refolding chaperone [Mariprofundus ferrooxydans]KON48006.1 hypothetical protein AL013_04430 [Mariprofundus ferrooxydans]